MGDDIARSASRPSGELSAFDDNGTGGLFSFGLYDTVVVSNDGFTPPTVEVMTAGKDGCLTRTADNIGFDPGLDGNTAVVHGNVIVARTFTPADDIIVMELGAERPLWVRDEGTSTSLNGEVDRQGVAFGSGGGV